MTSLPVLAKQTAGMENEERWLVKATKGDRITVWVRLQVGDLPILWTGAREYNPDFLAVDTADTHWVIEVKMDKEMATADVQGKRDAAKRLLADGESTRRALIAVLVVGVTVTLVNAYFDPTLEGAQVAIWLWTLVGLGTALAHPKPTQLVRQHVSSRSQRLRGSKLRERELFRGRTDFTSG